MKKRIGAFVIALSIVALWSTPRTQADPLSARKVFMPTLHARDAKTLSRTRTSNMTYQGGNVETAPAVYISWWGPEWASGFTGGQSGVQVSSSTAQSYTTDFFNGVGGSAWNSINSQYCQGVSVGTVNCGSSGTHISNPSAELKGTWNDTTPVPSSPSQNDIANAAIRLMNHFGGLQPNATYFVYTPSGKSESGFGTSWCAWHSYTSTGSNRVPYAYIPYMPDAGGSCGSNFINSGTAGYVDGFSVVGGHEYAEAETDPYPANGSYAWVDSRGSEIGDKCAWASNSGNITLTTGTFAVQPLWSNAVSGCAMSG